VKRRGCNTKVGLIWSTAWGKSRWIRRRNLTDRRTDWMLTRMFGWIVRRSERWYRTLGREVTWIN
jgi:hypothetical protein